MFSSFHRLPFVILIALIISFIQSLGLTLQRSSHLSNERIPSHLKRPDYARPVWLIGFSIYFSFNLIGSIFQIATLPLILLGPLGAISLLWNAILARFLLAQHFSLHLILGTFFIALGALLIALFGPLPDQDNNHHDLHQLISLYFRTPFLIQLSFLLFTFSIICFIAHSYEFKLNRSIPLITPSTPPPLSPIINHQFSPLPSSTCTSILNPSLSKKPPHSFPFYPSRSLSSSPTHPHSSHPLSIPFSQHHSADQLIEAHIPLTPSLNLQSHDSHRSSKPSDPKDHLVQLTVTQKRESLPNLGRVYLTQKQIDRFKLIIGVVYGATSGTLSGICLLFAKTGVELLIRTLSGVENEFIKIQPWLILLVLLITALLQLWYLNKALRLVNPTLICPLAFCFYNLSAITSSLIYYDQIKLLSTLQILAISMGTFILLGGVWIVSHGPNNQLGNNIVEEVKEDSDDLEESMLCEDEVTPLLRASSRIEDLHGLNDEQDENHPNDNHNDDQGGNHFISEDSMQVDQSSHSHRFETAALHSIRNHDRPRSSLQLDPRCSTSSNSHPFDYLIRQFLLDGHVSPARGFSFGLGAASPGFAIRPKRRNTRTSEPLIRSNNASFNFHSYPSRLSHNHLQQHQ